MKETLEGLEDIASEADEKREELYAKGRDKFYNGTRRAKEFAEDVDKYLQDHPVVTVLSVIAFGAVTGWAFSRFMERDDRVHIPSRVRHAIHSGERAWSQVREGLEQVLAGVKTVLPR